jgi:glycosyltransferase involved in cell wall biosynthesis
MTAITMNGRLARSTDHMSAERSVNQFNGLDQFDRYDQFDGSETIARADGRSAGATGATRLVLASRGDALTPYLFEALAQRYPVAGRISVELSRRQRAIVAASTMRTSRTKWAEQFYKSALGYDLRSANAGRASQLVEHPWDIVLQVHALFHVRDARSVLYVDCTHRQSAAQWPAWNPLSGAALRRWYERERAEYLRAAHLFAFSVETSASLTLDYGVDPERVTVVGAGANRPLHPTVRATGRLEHDRHHVDRPPTILFIGNDFVRKGGVVLLDAFRHVRSTVPNARLQLVGTRPAIAAQDGVDVLGRIHDRSQIASLYSAADVFCLPAFFDPYPLVVLEAMSHQLPVVASTSVGIPEMVIDGETGLLVPAGSVDRLADALISLLSSPTRAAQLGRAGQRRVASSFTWDAVVDRMAPVLDRLGADVVARR